MFTFQHYTNFKRSHVIEKEYLTHTFVRILDIIKKLSQFFLLLLPTFNNRLTPAVREVLNLTIGQMPLRVNLFPPFLRED